LADACRYRVWVGELLIAQQGHAVDIESGTCCDGVASEKWQEEEPKMRLTCWQRSLVLPLSELSLLRLARPIERAPSMNGDTLAGDTTQGEIANASLGC